MKMLRQARLALALAVAGLSLPPAHALSFDDVPAFDAMVAAAPLAFRGKVLRIADGQARGASGAPVPYTSITLRVAEAFAGSRAGSEITLRQLGGRIEGQPNRLLMIPGLAEFEVGEEVYVFADDRKQPFFATLYGELGLYRVARDGDGAPRVLTSDWRPLRSDGRAWRGAPGQMCRPLVADRSRCALSVEPPRDRSDSHDVVARSAAESDVGPAAFDARIRALTASKPVPALPGQTLSRSRMSFEAALVALRDRGLRLHGQRPTQPTRATAKPMPTEETK